MWKHARLAATGLAVMGLAFFVQGASAQQTFLLPSTTSGASWTKLGTVTAAQQGFDVTVQIVSSQGFNALISQDQVSYVHFKTSNDSSVDANGFAGDSWWYTTGESTAAPANIKWVANAAGVAATAFTLYADLGYYSAKGFYVVNLPTGATWTNYALAGQTDPGAASSTVEIPTNEFFVGSTASFASNVGIGTTAPGAKLEVNGGIKLTAGSGGTLTFADGTSQSTAAGTGITQVNGNVNVQGVNLNAAATPNFTAPGPYIGWNQSAGGGETDFVNNMGQNSPGGFQFFNTPASGSPKTLLMSLSPTGLGIGTANPGAPLEVNGNTKVDGSYVYVGQGGGYYYSDATNEVISGNSKGNVYLAPGGVNGTHVAQGNGSLFIGGPGQTSATLTFADGTVQSTAAAPVAAISNGTANTLPLFTGSSALANSLITQNGYNIGIGGNLGIGTSTPQSSLDISQYLPGGNGVALTLHNLVGQSQQLSTTSILFASGYTGDNTQANRQVNLAALQSGGLDFNGSNGFLSFQTSSAGVLSERMRLGSNGYFGIGTSTPSAPLEVNGNAKVDGNYVYVGTGGGYFYSDPNNEVISGPASGSVYLAPWGVNGTHVAVGSGSLFVGGPGQTGATLTFADGTVQSTAAAPVAAISGGTANTVPLFTGSSTLANSAIVQSSTGNIGIGTTSPGELLTVNGGFVSTSTNPGQYSLTQIDSATSPIASANALGAVFAGDTHLRSFWGVSVDINSGNLGDLQAGALFTRIPGTSSFTINSRNSASSFQTLFTVRNSGNVGIGTTTPGSSLEVNGNVKLTSGSGASVTYQDNTVQTTAWNGVLQGGDYAESVEVTGERSEYQPGDVMVVDPDTPGKFLKSSSAYSTAVAGIYSTAPGARGRRQTSDRSHMAEEVPMAMIGIVPTKVTAEGGRIRPGDLLVTSSRPGYAMKGTDRTLLPGAIVGKAVGNLDSGTGLIEVLVSLQ